MQMTMQVQDIQNLLIAAQTETGYAADVARNDLIIEIIDNHMHRHLAKYYKKSTVGTIDRDDIDQIFLIACSNAIAITDPYIGNPLLFILQKGKWAVSDEIRKLYRRNLRQYCHRCGTGTRLNERAGEPICPKCNAIGNEWIEREQFNMTDDGSLSAYVESDENLAEEVESNIGIEQFRNTLKGRVQEVFDLIIYEGYDRDSCKNYQKELSELMGISQANVNARIRTIKAQYTKWTTEDDEQ